MKKLGKNLRLFGIDLKNVLLSVWYIAYPQKPFFYIGRLYKGYIGIMVYFWFFDFTLLILNWEH